MLHHPMILQCPLFQGLPPDALEYALSYFEAHVKAYEKGDFLHQVSFPLERFGLVLSGTIQVSMDDMDGHHIIMNNVSAGGLFGEASWAPTPPFTSARSPRQRCFGCALPGSRRPASPSRSGIKCWPTGLWRLWPPAPSP